MILFCYNVFSMVFLTNEVRSNVLRSRWTFWVYIRLNTDLILETI